MAELSVGVAMAVRDGADWLAAALDSVVAQTVRVAEVVVVDDGSQDDSAAVAAGYAPLVRVRQIAPSGLGAARNVGFGLVRADLIATLDQDDLLTPDSLGCRMAVLREDPSVELVFGHTRRFSTLCDGAPVALDVLRPAHLSSALLVRRGAYARVGPFAERVRVSEGLDWLLRAREQAIVEHTVPDQVIWRRVHGRNMSLTNRDAIGELPRALKASLDRRRRGAG